MVLTAMDHKEDALKTFEQAKSFIVSDPQGHQVKLDMLGRLALGHINRITQGDRNLEKENWHPTQ